MGHRGLLLDGCAGPAAGRRTAGGILVHARKALRVTSERAAPLWRKLWLAMKKLASAS